MRPSSHGLIRVLPGPPRLVLHPRAGCGFCADALHEVNFNLLQLARRKKCCMPRPPLPCPYPCAWPLAHNHRDTPRDRSLAGRPCHPHALRRRHGYHSAAAWAVRRGARQWLERSNLLIQPILTPENAGTTSHAPCTALTLSLAHVAVRRRMPLALAADADRRKT